jgi:hypothetical protein
MKTFQALRWNIDRCWRELEQLRDLLARARILKERDDILPFFQRRLHLSAFLGSYHPNIARYDLVAHEYDLFGDYTCDIVVGDSQRKVYGFVELEDAAPKSVFVKKKGKSQPEWAPRFEHGFNQLIDWFHSLDDMQKTDEFEGRFGKRTIEYFGLLVVGKDEVLGPKEMRRLAWHQEKVIVNSIKVYCVTFDQLYNDLKERLTLGRGEMAVGRSKK